MSDRLREDLRYVEDNWDEVNDPEGRVAAAARRFLALAETGPDYEAAIDELIDWLDRGRLVNPRDATKTIVDAALADYLTEEDT